MPSRRSASTIAIAVSSVMLMSGLALTASRAAAMVPVPEDNPGLLSVYADSYPLHYTDMAPGEEAFVRLDVVLSDSSAGELSLQVRKSGELATMNGGLEMDVKHCDEPWTNVPLTVTEGVVPLCSSGSRVVLHADDSTDFALDSPTWNVDDLQRDTVDHLLVRLGIPLTTSLASVEGRSAEFAFGLTASGLEDPIMITPSGLALTGFDSLYLALVGAGIIGIGIAVRIRRSAGPAADRGDLEETA